MRGPPGEEQRQEIIIVRRSNNDDDHGHHGGAWKIAFADFMTAMMCFFLVMWLINAANEQTRAAVASYFNPVKLIDRNTNRKGIDDLGKGPQTSSSDSTSEMTTNNPVAERRALTGPASETQSSDLSETAQHSDKNLFADPYAVLAEIVADVGQEQNISARGDGGASDAGPADGASGGESYRDPFAPDFWSTQMETPQAGQTTQASLPEGPVVDEAPDDATDPLPDARDPFLRRAVGTEPDARKVDRELAELFGPAEVATPAEPAAEPVAKAAAEAQDTIAGATPPAEEPDAPAPPAEQVAETDAEPVEPRPDARAQALAAEIKAELEQAFGGTANLRGISVETGDGGIMISVADEMQDGMFEIGSAVPRRDLVVAMEKIGRTLAAHEGRITINGHTDARPFANEEYDNWRLSSARAQSTYYMLVRGGLDEMRVKGVAGYADRELKRPDEPYAAINRRIEILLETAG